MSAKLANGSNLPTFLEVSANEAEIVVMNTIVKGTWKIKVKGKIPIYGSETI